jgi:hypothetical protein
MNRITKSGLLTCVFAIGLALATSQAHATPITLTFGDLVNESDINSWFTGTQINPFYNPSNPANGPQYGPADGVVFSSNAEELRSGVNGHAPSGGSGKFENNPSGVNGVLYFGFSTTTTSYLNDANGFIQLSFDYSLLNNSSSYDDTVNLYSGLNGTGILLASLSLTPNGTTVACTTTGDEFCTWSLASTGNVGVAESIYFGGTSSTPLEGIEFDEVQLTPTPLPAALPLFAGGLGVMGLLGWRRKHKNAAALAAA